MNNLLEISRKENESIELPDSVTHVRSLMDLLVRRGDTWKKFFAVAGALLFQSRGRGVKAYRFERSLALGESGRGGSSSFSGKRAESP